MQLYAHAFYISFIVNKERFIVNKERSLTCSIYISGLYYLAVYREKVVLPYKLLEP